MKTFTHYKITILSLCIAMLAVFGMASCGKKDANSPGVEYMPDMYRSPSYESNGVNEMYLDSMANRKPAPGSIARGFLPYALGNDSAGYANAANLKNPLAYSEQLMKEGEELYSKYCVHCHGKGGKGDGKVADKLPGPPPAYDGTLKDLPAGKIFHSITYGKGMMGSHAGQLTQEERWKLVYFVQKLQGHNPAAPKTEAVADSTAHKETVAEAKH
jgi:mono/diheme cytochrome c family protein